MSWLSFSLWLPPNFFLMFSFKFRTSVAPFPPTQSLIIFKSPTCPGNTGGLSEAAPEHILWVVTASENGPVFTIIRVICGRLPWGGIWGRARTPVALWKPKPPSSSAFSSECAASTILQVDTQQQRSPALGLQTADLWLQGFCNRTHSFC